MRKAQVLGELHVCLFVNLFIIVPQICLHFLSLFSCSVWTQCELLSLSLSSLSLSLSLSLCICLCLCLSVSLSPLSPSLSLSPLSLSLHTSLSLSSSSLSPSLSLSLSSWYWYSISFIFFLFFFSLLSCALWKLFDLVSAFSLLSIAFIEIVSRFFIFVFCL